MTVSLHQAHRTRYNRARRLQIAAGTWQPWGDLDAVRAHITDLVDARWSVRGIAQAAGVADCIIRRIRTGEQARISTDNADRILAVQSRRRVGYVPADGARRRLRALAVQGHSLRAVAAETGLNYVSLSNVRRGATRSAQPRVARLVAAAYTRLLSQEPDGDVARVQSQAVSLGWPGPEAWDRYTIDDPDARPLS